MAVSHIYIHADAALPSTGSVRTLREGSFVSVHVLSRTGTDTYSVSFAGTRFDVSSRTELTPGTVFRAAVTYRDGKIALIPQHLADSSGVQLQNFQNDVSAQTAVPLTDPQLVSYFTSLGLVPDSVSMRLVQQLEQLGARFDSHMLARIRIIASRFPGHESEAAETALVLESKGIESTDEAVQQLLYGGDSSSEHKKGSFSGSRQSDPDNTETEPDDSVFQNKADDAVKEYIHSVFNGQQDGNKPGFLTIFNQLGNFRTPDAQTQYHWIVLPFTLGLKTAAGERSGSGIIRFFSDIKERKCKKIVLSIEICGQKQFFVIQLDKIGKSIEKAYFCIQPEPGNRSKLTEQFSQFIRHGIGKSADIEWIDYSECYPFFTENTPLSTVQGSV